MRIVWQQAFVLKAAHPALRRPGIDFERATKGRT